MIDFRYHLVSIVSVFLALAVGIVLGAGPLQGQIADTLTSEITQLRADKQSLRSEVSALNQQVSVGDAYDNAILSRVVGGQVAGRGVAVVELPGADADLVRTVSQTLVAGGATITSTTRLLDSWVATDTKTATARTAVINRLAPTLKVAGADASPGPGGGGSTGPTMADRVLAAALTSTSGVVTPANTPDAARAALAELVTAQLIDMDPKSATPAQLVVVVAEPMAGNDAQTSARAAAWVQLVAALDAGSVGTVLVAPNSSAINAEQQTSIVRVLRLDGAVSKAVSTVDDAATGKGLASIVLALVQQESGGVGHFGVDDSATAPYAPLPTP